MKTIKKYLLVSAVTVLLSLFLVPVLADTISPIDFESPAYSLGNIDGQNGWMKTGSYDVEVADVSTFPNAASFGFDDQALRLSNAVTTGAFGDQTFTPGLASPAGESLANNHFEASFDIGSTQSTQQSGLFLSVSPDDGNGSRMSYVGFEDQSDGIHVIFYDVTDAGPLGAVASFNGEDVATINRTEPHSIKFEMDFVPGVANDVVNLYVDGSLVKTGTSWEDYYRYDPEQSGNGNLVPETSKLIFREGGAPAVGTNGNGYLVDNVSLSSSSNITPPSQVEGMTIFQNSNEIGCGAYITQRTITVKWDASIDPNFDHYQYQADADMTAPYDFTTNVATNERTGNVRDEDGTYSYRVREVNQYGTMGDWSNWCSVTLDRSAPEVEITNPSEGDTVSGTVDVRGSVNDDNPDHYYLVIKDDGNHIVDGPGTVNDSTSFTDKSLFSWDTTSLPDGDYTVWLAARDAAGNRDDSVSLDKVTVAVNNTPDEMNQCKKGGWSSFYTPTFKNQGDCVSWLQSSPNAKGNRKDN